MSTVLICDDDETTRHLLVRILRTRGYSVRLAADGEAALREIEGGDVDLVILDLLMPIMNGWDVLGKIGRREGAPPVIVLSAYPDDQRAFTAGARRCFVKPFRYEQLVAACAAVIEQRPT
jgi:DNA-binding response OmpR family regulator